MYISPQHIIAGASSSAKINIIIHISTSTSSSNRMNLAQTIISNIDGEQTNLKRAEPVSQHNIYILSCHANNITLFIAEAFLSIYIQMLDLSGSIEIYG